MDEKVKRYSDVYGDGDPSNDPSICVDGNGNYVEYKDYARLEKQLEETKEAIKSAKTMECSGSGQGFTLDFPYVCIHQDDKDKIQKAAGL